MEDPSRSDVSAQSEPKPGQLRAGASRSRARFRTSLACVPCRSKHVKCDGVLPACERCQLDEKACIYAKSRRGIRDPRKRSMMKDEAPTSDQDEASENTPSPNFTGCDITVHLTRPLPAGWIDPETRNPRPVKYLFDLYYATFHSAHSWLPPKETLGCLVQAKPREFNFIMTMILYIGSMYTDNVDSTSLRDAAYELASKPPTTVWDVQALLCMCIAAFGEQRSDLCDNWHNTAVKRALELGLQHKDFADKEEDPVLAESYRRTYWALYTHGSLRTVREHLQHYQLYSTPATTELPCEEWEYQAGEIPIPTTLDEYNRECDSRDFSSWAYLVDLTRICGAYVVPILNIGDTALEEAVDSADHRIQSWLMRLPEWKKELIDPDGAVVDTILYHALGIAHGLRIRIQLRLKGVGIESGVQYVAHSKYPVFCTSVLLPPNVTARNIARLPGSMALQASLELVALFKFRLPPEKFSPSCIMGLERAALPLVDAYLHGGRLRLLEDKISLLVSVLGKSGKFWPKSKSVSKEIDKVMKEPGGGNESPGESRMNDEGDAVHPFAGNERDTFQYLPPLPVAQMDDQGGLGLPFRKIEETHPFLSLPFQAMGDDENTEACAGPSSLYIKHETMGMDTTVWPGPSSLPVKTEEGTASSWSGQLCPPAKHGGQRMKLDRDKSFLEW
ncbi:hypothetical protein FZEAL_7404 [Fusarium zealandicum]|uniref:Zn(2)-C6 fungal-type domain-containing protein n=1 Tax=Fusarium zealandicum TaxID=1053134 RepID=A0A8H4UG50_9HYPO|nr:hypothetical protein FZEAL_7404 [Fusarium zealandicum]